MALLAWAVARLDDSETAAALVIVTGAAVVTSIALALLRPDLGLDDNGSWQGVYTNRNSLAPLAAIGSLVLICYAFGGGKRHETASLAASTPAETAGDDNPYDRIVIIPPDRARRALAPVAVLVGGYVLAQAGSRTAWRH